MRMSNLSCISANITHQAVKELALEKRSLYSYFRKINLVFIFLLLNKRAKDKLFWSTDLKYSNQFRL